MIHRPAARRLSDLLSDYGMVFALLALCAYLSVATRAEQQPSGPAAARSLADAIESYARVVIVVRTSDEDRTLANALERRLRERGSVVVETVRGQPADVRRALNRLGERGERIDVFACTRVTSTWGVLDQARERFPALAQARVLSPRGYVWPNFLKTENLLNVADQIAVIALIAVGMTLVIVTGGIDLSVGSLIALSAVVTTRLIRDAGGGESATVAAMLLAGLAGIAASAGTGVVTGLTITLFRIPPFIVTLAMMLVASGLAYILSHGQSINQVPDRFIALGRGAELFRVPNGVVLMLALYALAHLLMTRTVFGRYIYAVGGNPEAARLSGVPVRSVIVRVYTISGALAGLGGVVMASQLKSGAPTYGQMYELYIIAAVVVGGTSLSGGAGTIFGTLIGAFIIAVIQNGMNLMDVESYTQKIVLGLVILGAVLLDSLKRGWQRRPRAARE